MPIQRVSLRLTERDYARVAELAAAGRISLNSVIRQAVEHWTQLPRRERERQAMDLAPVRHWDPGAKEDEEEAA